MRFCRFIFALLILAEVSYAEEGMIIKLPEPKEKGNISLEETIRRRRSERRLQDKGLTFEQIGQLLWAAQGITDERRGFRSSPSAGATYPLEVYVVSAEGLFHYIPRTHSLTRLKDKDLRAELSLACYGQRFVEDAAIDIVIAADFRRTTVVYGSRGKNYVYIEVGHAVENLHLQAVGQGLGSVPVGAFSDDNVKEVLSLPENLVPIYIIPVGYVR